MSESHIILLKCIPIIDVETSKYNSTHIIWYHYVLVVTIKVQSDCMRERTLECAELRQVQWT